MPLDLKEYYRRIARAADALPSDEVDLISMDNPDKAVTAGTVTRAKRHLAAKLIIDRTHRIATEAEVAEDQKQMRVRLAHYAEMDKKRAPLEVIADRLSRTFEEQQNAAAAETTRRSARQA